MHLSDSMLSPAVGAAGWAVSAGAIAYCSAKVRSGLDDSKAPLMGVLGAFVFAAQMINFSIPGTGSSGHLGGGLLLAILLGPSPALLTIASVLLVQALFFADGGLLALGCNILNMGIIPAVIVYPLFFKKLTGPNPARRRLMTATMVSAVVALQLGAFAVVLETLFSGISALPFSTFVLLMQPIHLAIGVVEGAATVAVVSFVRRARPEILQGAWEPGAAGKYAMRNVLLAFLAAALFTGGFVSLFASKNPDGLEWAVARTAREKKLKGPDQGVGGTLAALQKKTALLPDYSFRKPSEAKAGERPPGEELKGAAGTGVAGVVGGLMTLVMVFLGAGVLKKRAAST